MARGTLVSSALAAVTLPAADQPTFNITIGAGAFAPFSVVNQQVFAGASIPDQTNILINRVMVDLLGFPSARNTPSSAGVLCEVGIGASPAGKSLGWGVKALHLGVWESIGQMYPFNHATAGDVALDVSSFVADIQFINVIPAYYGTDVLPVVYLDVSFAGNWV